MNIDKIQDNVYSMLVTKADEKENISNISEISEIEKMENFKKEIWNEINSMPWRCDISIQITDGAFEKMMNDKEFKDRMLSIIQEDANVSGFKGGGTILNIDESGYSGFSWMDGYKEGLAKMSEHEKDSFYHKKISKKQDYFELWEEKQHKREVLKDKQDKEYEEHIYLKQYYARKERATATYEAAMIIE